MLFLNIFATLAVLSPLVSGTPLPASDSRSLVHIQERGNAVAFIGGNVLGAIGRAPVVKLPHFLGGAKKVKKPKAKAVAKPVVQKSKQKINKRMDAIGFVGGRILGAVGRAPVVKLPHFLGGAKKVKKPKAKAVAKPVVPQSKPVFQGPKQKVDKRMDAIGFVGGRILGAVGRAPVIKLPHFLGGAKKAKKPKANKKPKSQAQPEQPKQRPN